MTTYHSNKIPLALLAQCSQSEPSDAMGYHAPANDPMIRRPVRSVPLVALDAAAATLQPALEAKLPPWHWRYPLQIRHWRRRLTAIAETTAKCVDAPEQWNVRPSMMQCSYPQSITSIMIQD